VKTVQSWEIGQRHPNSTTNRLLEILESERKREEFFEELVLDVSKNKRTCSGGAFSMKIGDGASDFEPSDDPIAAGAIGEEDGCAPGMNKT
jgi:hypothetical protein